MPSAIFLRDSLVELYLYHKIASITSLSSKKRVKVIAQEFLDSEKKKEENYMLSFKRQDPQANCWGHFFPASASNAWGALAAYPLRKDNPIVNIICAPKNIWMVIPKQLLSFQDH